MYSGNHLLKRLVSRRGSSLRINSLTDRQQVVFRLLSTSSSSVNPFEAPHLQRRAANFTPLTPLSLYERSVELFPTQTAYIHGNVENHAITWGEMHNRVVRFGSGLKRFANLRLGDVVSIIAPNTPAMLEAHMAIPGIGAVLHSINTRLDATTIAYQLHHCQAKVVLVDSEYNALMLEVKEKLRKEYSDFKMPQFVMIHDVGYSSDNKSTELPWVGDIDLETIMSSGDATFELMRCKDEFDAITLNYTSGTTGNPKGVVTHHRGAYLNAIGNLMEWNMPRFSKFLWFVPMFHCNGWCFPWTLGACTGTSVLVRQVRAPIFFDLMERFKIGFFGGAPIIMSTLLNAPERKKFQHKVKMWTAGSPPPPSVIQQFQDVLGIETQTVYGLTEVYGPVTSHIIDPDWIRVENLSQEELMNRSIVQARDILKEDIQVLNPETMEKVPSDGKTLGEVMIRGNIVMKGYLHNPKATEECFEKGWFHTGDLAVSHGRGRFEIKDRSKDIIISGGENISSVEVENIMMTHGCILEVAVVAKPDEKWGEVPAAFVILKAPHLTSHRPTEVELMQWCRTKMAGFQCPKYIQFLVELPKTSTGKVQKHSLRKYFTTN